MVKDNCPGSRPKLMTTVSYNCTNCGYKIEVFSDDIEIKCPKCNINT